MLPIGDDNSARRTVPVVTYALIAVNVLFFLVELSAGEDFIRQWSVIPRELLAKPVGEFITIFTAMFMHGGWLHHYMKKIYYDTMVFGAAQLQHLVNLWGADHVVIGTDYPYDMGYYKPVDFVERTKGLTRAQKDQIIGGNAAKILGLKRRAS